MMRAFLCCMLLPTAALAQTAVIEPWQVIDFVAGDFGAGGGSKAFLVNDDEGRVDLYIFDERYLGFRSPKDPVHVPYITGMVKQPPELSLTQDGGFEIAQLQSTIGWGSWTNADRIKYLDGDYYYVGHTFEFTSGIAPFDSITCDYDYEYGIVDVLAINENEEITLMEEYPISPAQSDFVAPEYASVEYDFPDIVKDLCRP